MCGRYALTHSPADIADHLRLDALEGFPPRYNIAPTQPILLVLGDTSRRGGASGPTRRAMLARWGFIPAWAKDPADLPLLVNARSESAGERNAFRGALRHRRCLVPASAFYLWKRDGGAAGAPFLVRPRDGRSMAFGGLFETFMAADGSEIDTALILTTEAGRGLSDLSDRAPVVVPPGSHARWLDCASHEPAGVADLFAPLDVDGFETVALTPRVNDAANMGPDVQEPKASASREP